MRDLPSQGYVVKAHRMSYEHPLIVSAGEEVTVGERDTRWPYVWCVNRDGVGGWIPDSYIRRDGADRGHALADFDSTELTVQVGERVTIGQEEGGWLRCTNQDGRSGWVPAENVQRQ